MRDDLGTAGGEVYAAAREVLAFWFDETPADRRFAKDEDLDRAIRDRFDPLRRHVLATDADGWRDDPATLTAAIVLLDQFSRNVGRNSAEAFAADPLARTLTRIAIDRGWDDDMPAEWRQFVYLPLMHSEDSDDQADSVALYEELGNADALAFAREHREVIDRHGRFPSRNAALGRESTPDERAYLSQPGAGW